MWLITYRLVLVVSHRPAATVDLPQGAHNQAQTLFNKENRNICESLQYHTASQWDHSTSEMVESQYTVVEGSRDNQDKRAPGI